MLRDGINFISDGCILKLQKNPTPEIKVATKKVEQFRIESLVELKDRNLISIGNGFARSAKHFLWSIEKDGDTFLVKRSMDEDGNPICLQAEETTQITASKKKAELSSSELFQAVLDKGIEYDSHENDLYIPKNEVTEQLINDYKFKTNVETFRDNISKTIWYDIPFAYVKQQKKANKITPDMEGVWLDGSGGRYIGKAVQEIAIDNGWEGEPVLDPDDYENYDYAFDEAEEYLNTLAPEGFYFSSMDGDWGLWKMEDDSIEASKKTAIWKGRLQKQYEDFEEFQGYDRNYGLAERLGFDSAEEAWEANPMIQGGVNPEDYKVVKANKKSALTLWKSAPNYMGKEFNDYYVGPGQSRDSDVLEKANFEAALTMLGGENEPDVIVEHARHWAVGYVEQILVHKDSDKVAILEDIESKLESYPVLDDDLYSNMQHEEYEQDYESWAKYQAIETLELEETENERYADEEGYSITEDELHRIVYDSLSEGYSLGADDLKKRYNDEKEHKETLRMKELEDLGQQKLPLGANKRALRKKIAALPEEITNKLHDFLEEEEFGIKDYEEFLRILKTFKENGTLGIKEYKDLYYTIQEILRQEREHGGYLLDSIARNASKKNATIYKVETEFTSPSNPDLVFSPNDEVESFKIGEDQYALINAYGQEIPLTTIGLNKLIQEKTLTKIGKKKQAGGGAGISFENFQLDEPIVIGLNLETYEQTLIASGTLKSFDALGYDDGMRDVRGDLLNIIAATISDAEVKYIKEDIDRLRKEDEELPTEIEVHIGSFDGKGMKFAGYVRGDMPEGSIIEAEGSFGGDAVVNGDSWTSSEGGDVTISFELTKEGSYFYQDVFEHYYPSEEEIAEMREANDYSEEDFSDDDIAQIMVEDHSNFAEENYRAASKKSNKKKADEESEDIPVKIKIVKLDETEYWDKSIIEKTGKIWTYYIYNENEVTNLAEITGSYYLIPVEFETENQLDDEFYEEVQNHWSLGTDPIYMHTRQVEGMNPKEGGTFDTMEEAEDSYRSNPPYFTANKRKIIPKESSKKTAGYYGNITVEKSKNGVTFKLDSDNIDELREDYEKKGEIEILPEIFESLTTSGWDWISPEDIGALTDAPIITDSAVYNDAGELTSVAYVYWYPDYMVKSTVEELINTGETFWPIEKSEEDLKTKESSLGDDAPTVKVVVSKKYSHDGAERLVDILDEVHSIGAQFVDWDNEGRVILELYPSNYQGDVGDFENFINNHEYFDSVLTKEATMEKKSSVVWEREAVIEELTLHFSKNVDEEDLEDLHDEIIGSLDLDKGRYDSWGNAGSVTVDGTEYNIIEDEDEAERIAVELVKSDLETEPSMFSQDWLQSFITISDTDKRMMISDEEDSIRTDIEYDADKMDETDDELNIDTDDLYNQAENVAEEKEFDSEEEKEEWVEEHYEELLEKAIEDARKEYVEKEVSDRLSDFEDGLEDPVGYFVNQQGIYSVDDLMKANFIMIDIDAAAESAIQEDSWAHFLSHYDGNYETTDNGLVYFRES